MPAIAQNKKSPRKIAVLTGTRAEYGLLKPLLDEIRKDPKLELQLIVSGTHLEKSFGHTVDAIEADGMPIAAKVPLDLDSDTATGLAKSMAKGIIGFTQALSDLHPDILVLLGDRLELLAAAQAAMLTHTPLAHLHGGEATEGVIDEAIRHAVSKMSHWHFTATEPYRARVIQLGEDPKRVWNVGATAIDNLRVISLMKKDELEKDLDFFFDGNPNFLVTLHPVTLRSGQTAKEIDALLSALARFPHAKILFTKANADAEGSLINSALEKFCAGNPRAKLIASLGQLRYLSAIKASDLVVGNSSSGLMEVPALAKATVNIGSRQQGRIRPASVVDCAPTAKAIEKAIRHALSPAHTRITKKGTKLYGNGFSAKKIKNILAKVKLENILLKKFHSIPSSRKKSKSKNRSGGRK